MIFSKQEEKIHIRIGIGYVFVTFNSTTNAENKTDFNRSKIVFEFVLFFPMKQFLHSSRNTNWIFGQYWEIE